MTQKQSRLILQTNGFFEWIGREFYGKVEQVKLRYDGILRSLFDAECIFVNFNYTPFDDVVEILSE